MQTAGGVDNNDIRSARFRRAQSVIHHRCRIAALLVADDIRSGALCPNAELLGCCRAEGVACAKEHILALGLQACRELADGRSLTYAVYADHEDNRRLGVKLELCVHIAEHVLHISDKRFLGGFALVYIAAQQNTLIIHHYLRRGLAADIGHYQHFLKLVVEILTVDIVIAEYLFKILDIFSGLCKTGEHFIKKAHCVPPQSFSIERCAWSRSSSMTFETPFSCIVTP